VVGRDDELPDVVHAELASLVPELAGFRSPSQSQSQVVHGDLTGNALFAESLAPAIIDVVP
jgi:hypothetical protein